MEEPNAGEIDEKTLAAWEAILLPDWRWEALEKREEGVYYGRVKSPKTYDKWEYGYFTKDQLEEALAYRVDEERRDHEPAFPDGGCEPNGLIAVYDTERRASANFDETG